MCVCVYEKNEMEWAGMVTGDDQGTPVCVCMCVCVCMHACMYVWTRMVAGDEQGTVYICVCVCVCLRVNLVNSCL
jgi:hypothetical protein